jgi:hypothetical protein
VACVPVVSVEVAVTVGEEVSVAGVTSGAVCLQAVRENSKESAKSRNVAGFIDVTSVHIFFFDCIFYIFQCQPKVFCGFTMVSCCDTLQAEKRLTGGMGHYG